MLLLGYDRIFLAPIFSSKENDVKYFFFLVQKSAKGPKEGNKKLRS